MNSNEKHEKTANIYESLDTIKDLISSIQSTKNETPNASAITELNISLNNLKNIHDKDVLLTEKDIESLKDGLTTLSKTLDKLNDDIGKLDNRLDSNDKIISDNYQEVKGDINQLKIVVDDIKNGVKRKKESKAALKANLLYPILVSIIMGVLIFIWNWFNTMNKLNDYNNHFPVINQQVNGEAKEKNGN